MKELEEILGEGQTPLEEAVKPAEPVIDPEIEKRKRELENLERAKTEALLEVQRLRAEKAKLKDEEEEIPKIDKEDPSSKAWLKEIQGQINPFQQESEKEKEEVFKFSLDEVLRVRPALAADAEQLKRVISTYERIKDNSGRTREGVIMDLNRAIAAETYQEVLEREREVGFEKAKDDLLFSSPAISRGATSYQQDRDRMPSLSDEERRIIEAQGWSVDEWYKAKKKHDNQ